LRTQLRKQLRAKLEGLGIQSWAILKIDEETRTIALEKDAQALQEEAHLDGVYIIKTDVEAQNAPTQTIHDRYKDLTKVESAFRTIKTGHLEVRPIYVRKDPRTRGHVFVVMLAYLLVQELEKCWKDLDMTVQEGIDELAALSIMQATVNTITFLKLPEPSQRARQLLTHAQMALPLVLPTTKKGVHTKNLQHRG
jgi:transposase